MQIHTPHASHILPKDVPLTYSTHAAYVEPMRLATIMQQANEPIRTRLQQLFYVLFEAPIPSPPPGRRYFSSIRDEDVMALERSKIIQEVEDDFDVNCSIFLVPEHGKQRVRVITWTRGINDIPYESEFSLGDVIDIVADVAACKERHLYALTFDLKISFYQVEIPVHAQRRFCFAHKGKKYVMLRLPMGAAPSAEFMHLLLIAITDVRERVFTYRLHIDNVRLLGTRPQLKEVVKILQPRCEAWSVTIKEDWNSVVSQSAEFFNLTFDYAKRTRRLSEMALEKIKLAQRHASSAITRRDWARIIGRIFHYARAMGHVISQTHTAISLWLSTLHIDVHLSTRPNPWDEKCSVPDAVVKEAKSLMELLLVNNEVSVDLISRPLRDSVAVLFTDATLESGAGILMRGSLAPLLHSLSFTESHSVNYTELYKVLSTLKHFFHHLLDAHVHLVTDSAVTMQILQKRSSKTPALDEIVKAIYSTLSAMRATLSVSHIDGILNPSDAPSRQKPINVPLLLAQTQVQRLAFPDK